MTRAGAPAGEPVVAVVGAGLSGLAAAWRLLAAPGRRRVVLLEQSPRTGGLLHRVPLPGPAGGSTAGPDDAGAWLDVGAEAFLARRPEALDLVAELGLGSDLVHPDATRAAVASRSGLHPMPPATVMGVPGRSALAALSPLLTPDEVARAAAEPVAPAPVAGDDVALGAFVADRLGDAVVDRLVEPLLGGVYAGDARRLSLRSCVPALWPAARDGVALLDAVPVPAPATPAAPVFGGLRGGVARLAETLHERLVAGGADVRTGIVVRSLRRLPAGDGPRWRLGLGASTSREHLDADAVVLALPAARASRLLAADVPAAAAALAGVQTASVAVVAAALPPGTLDALTPPGLSGVLVPPVEGHLVKAMTFSSRKWRWVAEAAGGRDVVRLSVGRAGREADLLRDDDDLVAAAVDDAAAVLGGALRPQGLLLRRWGGALPQYAVGHPAVVARAGQAAAGAGGLALAGAVHEGVGVPACLASASRAAAAVLADLDDRRPGSGRADAGATMRP